MKKLDLQRFSKYTEKKFCLQFIKIPKNPFVRDFQKIFPQIQPK